MLPARREDTKKGSPYKRCSMKEIVKFYAQIGYLLNLSAADGGETLGERKEKQEGRGRLAALMSSHPRFCGGSNGCQALLLGLQLAPGYTTKSLTTTYFSFLLQEGLKGSTYSDARRQPKTLIQFHAEVKTRPHQQKRMTFPLNHI